VTTYGFDPASRRRPRATTCSTPPRMRP